MISTEPENLAFPKSACGGLLKDPDHFPSDIYRGERVYFCNSACLQAFLKFPDAFMAGEIEHPNSENVAATSDETN